MVLRDGLTSVTVTLREPGPPGTPSEGDLGIDVSVDGRSFSGRNDTVWVAKNDWARFLQDMRDLERTRRGQAHIKAMSPEEFQLAVFAKGQGGRLVAEGWVGRDYTGRAGPLRDRVSFSLELDPTGFARLVDEATALRR
jgi:hypothetical protein